MLTLDSSVLVIAVAACAIAIGRGEGAWVVVSGGAVLTALGNLFAMPVLWWIGMTLTVLGLLVILRPVSTVR